MTTFGSFLQSARNARGLILRQLSDLLPSRLSVSFLSRLESGKISAPPDTVTARQHFRTAYALLPSHKNKRPLIFQELSDYALRRYGPENVRVDTYSPKTDPNDFLVVTSGGAVESSLSISPIAERTTLEEIGLILVTPALKDAAQESIADELNRLLLEIKTEEEQMIVEQTTKDRNMVEEGGCP